MVSGFVDGFMFKFRGERGFGGEWVFDGDGDGIIFRFRLGSRCGRGIGVGCGDGDGGIFFVFDLISLLFLV